MAFQDSATGVAHPSAPGVRSDDHAQHDEFVMDLGKLFGSVGNLVLGEVDET